MGSCRAFRAAFGAWAGPLGGILAIAKKCPRLQKARLRSRESGGGPTQTQLAAGSQPFHRFLTTAAPTLTHPLPPHPPVNPQQRVCPPPPAMQCCQALAGAARLPTQVVRTGERGGGGPQDRRMRPRRWMSNREGGAPPRSGPWAIAHAAADRRPAPTRHAPASRSHPPPRHRRRHCCAGAEAGPCAALPAGAVPDCTCPPCADLRPPPPLAPACRSTATAPSRRAPPRWMPRPPTSPSPSWTTPCSGAQAATPARACNEAPLGTRAVHLQLRAPARPPHTRAPALPNQPPPRSPPLCPSPPPAATSASRRPTAPAAPSRACAARHLRRPSCRCGAVFEGSPGAACKEVGAPGGATPPRSAYGARALRPAATPRRQPPTVCASPSPPPPFSNRTS